VQLKGPVDFISSYHIGIMEMNTHKDYYNNHTNKLHWVVVQIQNHFQANS